MKLLLLSGGSGKRLWPYSNDARSKQFLKILPTSSDTRQSMVQRVWTQLKAAGLDGLSYIATSAAQTELLKSQLGAELKLILEPERRDTFPAIALACAYLSSVEKTPRDEVVVVLPVDPYTDDLFFETVQYLETALLGADAELGLIGTIPTYPSEKYGYIIPREAMPSEWHWVEHFVEKPGEAEALRLMDQQALWNCGVFAFRLGFVLDKILELGLPCTYDSLVRDYKLLPKISFDYHVVERTPRIIALRHRGFWKDLGTWNTLTEVMEERVHGQALLTADCKNTHVMNELDIPVAVLGISDAVIAVSPDGILVADKEATTKLKEVVGRLETRPMYEERRWGWYRVLDHVTFHVGKEVLTKRINIKAGENLSYQLHHCRSEIWTIIRGTGELALDGAIFPVKSGDVLHIGVGARHGLRAITELELIEVQMGRELIEEDIVRLFMTWEEIESHCASQPSLIVEPVPGHARIL